MTIVKTNSTLSTGKKMNNKELLGKLEFAIETLNTILEEIATQRVSNKLTRSLSPDNDPLEFYLSCCKFQRNSQISGSDLFLTYKQWCNNNGSLSRGKKPFLEAISQAGIADGVQGVIRGRAYTFKNLAIKPD